MIGANSGVSDIQCSLINGYQRSTGCLAVAACVYHPLPRALRAINMISASATMTQLQYIYYMCMYNTYYIRDDVN